MRVFIFWLFASLAGPVSGSKAVSVAPFDTARASANEKPCIQDRVNDADLEAVFRDLESAWRSGDVGTLAPHLGRRGVGLSLAGDDPADGWFSRNQTLAILSRLLREHETSRFDILHLRAPYGGAGRPNGAAAWERRSAPGALARQILFVSFAREGDRWMVAEIWTADR